MTANLGADGRVCVELRVGSVGCRAKKMNFRNWKGSPQCDCRATAQRLGFPWISPEAGCRDGAGAMPAAPAQPAQPAHGPAEVWNSRELRASGAASEQGGGSRLLLGGSDGHCSCYTVATVAGQRASGVCECVHEG